MDNGSIEKPDVEIPRYADFMYPTLKVLEETDDEANSAEIDEAVLKYCSITDEQLAVEFPEESTQSGSKVRHRLAWARSYLKKLDAVESAGRGKFNITDRGRQYLSFEQGEKQLLTDEHQLRVGSSPDLFLRALEPPEGDERVLTVRELLAGWGVKRRGNAVVARIQHDLDRVGLITEPPFKHVPLDGEIRVRQISAETTSNSRAASPPESNSVGHTETEAETIGKLQSTPLATTTPDANILEAQSLMQSHDYSQLAVTSGERNLKGVISWESIAKANLYGKQLSTVSDAMKPEPPVVSFDRPLLNCVDRIVESGFVFIKDGTNRLTGVVTTADLSKQFSQLANPFLLIGEIESLLRIAVNAVLTPEDLADYIDPQEPDRQIEAAENLTFGEYVRLFENPEVWEKFSWPASRKVFCAHLDEVRSVRNSIMHFSVDEISDEDTGRILALLDWLRVLVDSSHSQV